MLLQLQGVYDIKINTKGEKVVMSFNLDKS